MEASTLTIHIRIEVELRGMIGRSVLEPYGLPDARAGPVEDVAGPEGLLADRDDIVISGIMHKQKPAVEQVSEISGRGP